MPFLLSPCVLWISTCISFLSADSIISVSARLSSTVLLPCQFKRDPSQTPHVRWSIGSEVVFERRGKEFYQGERYEDRVDVPEDELLNGDCSLMIKNVRATDADIYKSFMEAKSNDQWDFVQNVEISIDETPMPDKANQTVANETSEEIKPRRIDTGMNSPTKQIIISSVIPCGFIALLAIIAIIAVMLYRRRNVNQPSNQTALNSNIDDEHRHEPLTL